MTIIIKNNYVELALNAGKIVGRAISPLLEQKIKFDVLSKAAPNGLYTATAPIAKLIDYGDGTIGSIVQEGGKITGHAGFEEVTSVSNFNPKMYMLMGFQVMSEVTNQYYLHEINEKLQDISEKVDDLLSIHNEEKIGILLQASKRLKSISAREHMDITDLNEIRQLKNDVGSIFEEYRLRVSRKSDELKNYEDGALFAEDKVNFMMKKITVLSSLLKVIYHSAQLIWSMELLEILARHKIDFLDSAILSLIDNFEKDYSKSFYKNFDKELSKLLKPIKRRIQYNINNTVLNKDIGGNLAKNIGVEFAAMFLSPAIGIIGMANKKDGVVKQK